ncbi:hypothetical protein [Bacillus pumilus]|uniref:hypothetical protein n=1 Tax=Bacillus pumilus TaxID=1408 RepID=UPI003CEC17AB
MYIKLNRPDASKYGMIKSARQEFVAGNLGIYQVSSSLDVMSCQPVLASIESILMRKEKQA